MLAKLRLPANIEKELACEVWLKLSLVDPWGQVLGARAVSCIMVCADSYDDLAILRAP